MSLVRDCDGVAVGLARADGDDNQVASPSGSSKAPAAPHYNELVPPLVTGEIDSIVVENRSRSYCEARQRAGV